MRDNWSMIEPLTKEPLNATMVFLSPQTLEYSKKTVEEEKSPFPVLSDLGLKVAETYKIVFDFSEDMKKAYLSVGVDLRDFNGDDTWRLPMPVSYVVDPSGTITTAFVDSDYTKRIEPEVLVEGIKKAGG